MDFIQFTIIDFIDIVAIAVIMFYLYKLTRGTQAPNILTGVIVIYLLWIVVKALNMEMLSAVLGHIIGVGVIALIVVFQPEIRRFLQVLGNKSKRRHNTFLSRLFDINDGKSDDTSYIAPIVKACIDMASVKTGALIVIQDVVDLSMVVETGVEIDATISSSLLKNIFFKNSPLHDGAVVINNRRIVAAKCILPTSQGNVPISFGMRHRAALGVSEITDAIVVVVSEESGGISIARGGAIRGITPSDLYEELLATIGSESDEVNSDVDSAPPGSDRS